MNKERVLQAALRSLGARDKDLSSEALLERVYDDNFDCFAPRALYGFFKIRRFAPEISVEGADVTFSGESIRRHLQGAEGVVLNAFTLGAGTDKRIKELSFVRPSESIALNAIASVYAELIADELLDRELETYRAEGYRTSFRFCPGYGDLALSTNESIQRALDAAKKIGLSVTKDGFLLPRKSIIGIAGVYPKGREEV